MTLKEWRETKGYSQCRLAKEVGVDRSMIMRVEHKISYASEKFQQKVLSVLGEPPEPLDWIRREVERRKCAICGEEFAPYRDWQVICGAPRCALKRRCQSGLKCRDKRHTKEVAGIREDVYALKQAIEKTATIVEGIQVSLSSLAGWNGNFDEIFSRLTEIECKLEAINISAPLRQISARIDALEARQESHESLDRLWKAYLGDGKQTGNHFDRKG